MLIAVVAQTQTKGRKGVMTLGRGESGEQVQMAHCWRQNTRHHRICCWKNDFLATISRSKITEFTELWLKECER